MVSHVDAINTTDFNKLVEKADCHNTKIKETECKILNHDKLPFPKMKMKWMKII